jgi:hypothetical protein
MSRSSLPLLILGLSLGPACGEWALRPLTKSPVQDSGTPQDDPPALQDTGTDTEDTGTAPPVPSLTLSPPDPPPDHPPRLPPEFLEDCTNPAASAAWGDGEIYVSTTGLTTRSGTLMVSETGLFHIYTAYSAESGASQQNESAYYRIENEDAPSGLPAFANCGEEWVVQDVDNAEPWGEDELLYIGTFQLTAGANLLKLNHYCVLYERGLCEELHFDEVESSTCPSDNPNSAHFSGQLCLLAAD